MMLSYCVAPKTVDKMHCVFTYLHIHLQHQVCIRSHKQGKPWQDHQHISRSQSGLRFRISLQIITQTATSNIARNILP